MAALRFSDIKRLSQPKLLEAIRHHGLDSSGGEPALRARLSEFLFPLGSTRGRKPLPKANQPPQEPL
jgi:hypothetical protein